MIKIWFREHTSLGARLISLWTNSKWCHVEIQIDNVSYGAHSSVGVVRQFGKDYNPKYWECFILENIDKKMLRDFCQDQLGKKYDWFAIFMVQIFRLSREHKNEWFCSEFVAAALSEQMDIFKSKIAPKWTPNDVYVTLKGITQ